LSPALANFLFEAVNFLLLAAALGWFLFKPVREALERERAQHQSQTESAERLHAEAETLQRRARETLAQVERDADEQRRQALARIEQEAKQRREAARQAHLKEREDLARELEAVRDAQADATAETLGRIAAESVRGLLDTLDGPDLESALTRAACERLARLPKFDARSVLVESARALQAPQRQALQQALGEGFSERTVQQLGAGVRVTTSSGQIDATAVAFAREAAHRLSASRNPKDDAESGGPHG